MEWHKKGLKNPFAPTTSTVRSEFFKPCQDSQEMAFCLNEGECFIIETVAGVHRHCRCKEGYRGLRCDQFVPKTDSILSDPSIEAVSQNGLRCMNCLSFGE
uniref:EGF-like domain-containing protein n=1 Tax=Cyprinus carpio TaxID=7962 RepID=A0A8C2BVZ2_CYPCA